MEAFELGDIMAHARKTGTLWTELIRHPTLSVGLYLLPGGGVDPQQPHTEDEVYYVVSGHGHITVGTEDRPVGPGSTIFVAAGETHRFHDFAAELTLLVFFAPAEGSLAP